MLWCSQYCVTIPMGVLLGENFTLTSNISYLIKGISERSIFNVGRVEIFVLSVSSEPGYHTMQNLMNIKINLVKYVYQVLNLFLSQILLHFQH